MMALYREHDSVLGRVRKSEDTKDCALHYRGGPVFLHEMLWFMLVSPWIVDGHIK